MNYLMYTLVTGLIATLVMDLWGILRKPLLGLPAADYRLVGRWVSYLARGQFQHENIAASPAVAGEQAMGWIAHYLLGLVFAGVMLAPGGAAWMRHPTPALPLLFGLVTVLVPFLVMQPAMGLGVAASRTARARAARVQSLLTHAIFGAGLYLGAVVCERLLRT